MDLEDVQCNTSDLALDKACLLVSNKDDSETFDLSAQSLECYLCPPWKYFSLRPHQNHSLVVNTTYPTNFFITDTNDALLHSIDVHFIQRGDYELHINSSNAFFNINENGNNEFVVVIVFSAIILSSLFLRIMFGWCLPKIQDYFQSRASAQDLDESHSIISGENGESDSVDESIGPIPPFEIEEDRGTIPDSSAVNTRLQSLDTFRGIAIILMIFVNYGGGKYYFFNHSDWNGLTVADLVFPWFMWIMGVCLTFSIKSQLRRGTSYTSMVIRIIERSIVLFLLGLVVNSIGHNHLGTLRVMGVLQRFSFCYLINALLELLCTSPENSTEYVRYWLFRDVVWSGVQWFISAGLVATQLLVTFLLHVPGCPTGYLGPGGLHDNASHHNCTGGAAGYVDQILLTKEHMRQRPTCKQIYDSQIPFDPEGVLGVLTSCLTVQLGVVAGRIILLFPRHRQRLRRFFIWAVILGILGGVLCQWRKEGGWIPVNKNLWSLSYVFVTSSFAFFLLLFLYYTIDVQRWWNGSFFRYAGLNSILLYIGHELTKKLFPWSWEPVAPFHLDHLLLNLWGTFLWILIAIMLHKNKLYFSV